MKSNWLIVCLCVVLLVGCTTSSNQLPPVNPNIPLETPGPLDRAALYWDMGISVRYPIEWADPLFVNGQMILARVPQVAFDARNLNRPLIAFSLVDTSKLGLTKDATLQAILAAVAIGPDVKIQEANANKFAGLDAAYMFLNDSKLQVSGYALCFRLPDGRVGTMIGLAPAGTWAYVAPAFDKIRDSAKLLKPADFPVPIFGNDITEFPFGGIKYTLPKGWVGRDYKGARVYIDQPVNFYNDDSGFSNGPQLMLIAVDYDKSQTLRQIVARSALPEDPVRELIVNGQPAVEVTSKDPVSGQIITFIGTPSLDQRVVILLRWTAPALLANALRPTLDAILRSITFSPITVPLGTKEAAPVTPTAGK